MSITLKVNARQVTVQAQPETPLLWVLRDELGLKGTKYSCGLGLCGACTVHLDGKAVRSCITPVSQAAAKRVTTIEGLGDSHPIQKAWVRHAVPQCGFCQSGQIMSAVALLASDSQPDSAKIEAAMSGNLCRCGTYGRIKAAIQSVVDRQAVTGE